jgi:enoyl-CoA hydratase/carnithine racemase
MTIRPDTFDYAHDENTGVATITLNRPDRLNSLTFEVYAELRDTFKRLDTEPGVRAIIITGQGRAFCSGGDVETIIGRLFERNYEGLLEFTRMTCELIGNIRRCRRPVIAALNGTVAGAGAVIASAADVRIASDKAKIAFLFTRVGLSGADMGAAWLLPKLIGFGRASQLLMTGEFVDAKEAERIGLYNQVVSSEELMTHARAFAEKLAKGPQFGLAMTKDLLNREAFMDFPGALEVEAQAQAVCMQHPDFREAYEAFMNKREPRFRS